MNVTHVPTTEYEKSVSILSHLLQIIFIIKDKILRKNEVSHFPLYSPTSPPCSPKAKLS